MPLDFHIGDQIDDASRTPPLLSVGLQVHSAFYRTELAHRCPALQRMDDYYSDYCFAGSELVHLIAEIDTVCIKMPTASPHQSWMQELRVACQTAIDNEKVLFALCD